MRPNKTRYVSSSEEFDKLKNRLKSLPCPRCGMIGWLVRHGYLWGHGDGRNDTVKRGWRIFCNNRGRGEGCGKTFSILQAVFLRRRMVDAGKLWQLLDGIRHGLCIKAAWEKIVSPYTLETAYRLWRAFRTSQSHIRTLLHRDWAPPRTALKSAPLQTIAHIQSIFSQYASPIAEFQLRYQSPFLSG